MNTRHDDDYNFVFKIILLGDTSVGKTHLLSRYIKGQLPRSKFPTIGVEFATKPVPLKTGGTVRVQIWDTGKSKIFILIICPTINHFEYIVISHSETFWWANTNSKFFYPQTILTRSIFYSWSRKIQGNNVGTLPEKFRSIASLRHNEGTDFQKYWKMDKWS